MKKYLHKDGRPYSKEEFIDKIKTDDDFSEKWGDLGKIYGHQWRNFNGVDQIENLINDLKNNPDSRRLMVSAWNPSELSEMVLPPCHYNFQCYTTELTFDERFNIFLKKHSNEVVNVEKGDFELTMDKLNIPKRKLTLMWNQRSCDFPLGIPVNISSYALLLIIISKLVNMIPYELKASLGDSHIYLNQIDGVKEQLKRHPLKLPTIDFSDNVDFSNLDSFLKTFSVDDLILKNYVSDKKIYFPLSN